jgi:hypothetical protein
MHLPAYVTKRKLSSGQFLGFNSPRFTRQTHSLHLLPGENCPVDSFWVLAAPVSPAKRTVCTCYQAKTVQWTVFGL